MENTVFPVTGEVFVLVNSITLVYKGSLTFELPAKVLGFSIWSIKRLEKGTCMLCTGFSAVKGAWEAFRTFKLIQNIWIELQKLPQPQVQFKWLCSPQSAFERVVPAPKRLERATRFEEAVESSLKAFRKLLSPAKGSRWYVKLQTQRIRPNYGKRENIKTFVMKTEKKKQIKKFIKRFWPDQHLMAFPFSFTQERPRKGSHCQEEDFKNPFLAIFLSPWTSYTSRTSLHKGNIFHTRLKD